MKHPVSFVGIDGEGKTLEDGSHLYTMLCSSTHASVRNETGLSSYECFDFLFSLRHDNPECQFVGFSFNYDVNMMLGDVPSFRVKELWNTNKTSYRHNGAKYFIEWIPSKMFRVMRFSAKKGIRDTFQMWDVFGFFQKSFVATLKEWGVGDSEQVERIAEMKDKRKDFIDEDESNILQYCFEECELLVSLMDKLEGSFIDAGILLDGYHGAGAAASALMKREKIKQHIVVLTQEDIAIEDVWLRAYYGGRTEIFRIGPVGDGWNYDINSAYPAATVELPPMQGTWKHVRTYEPNSKYAIWHVQWKETQDTIAPLPFRLGSHIRYCRNGLGWYHAVEVSAMLHCDGQWADVRDGFVFTPDSPDVRPFSFVRDIYNQRRKLKDVGHRAEKPLKLSINSIYGKLAQGYGREDRRPPYQSYYWAGYITSATRAKILEAVYPYSDKLIGIATDGIFSVSPIPDLAIGKELGQWEAKQFTDFFSAQPGVYAARVGDTEIKRNRGFTTKELDFAQLRAEFERRGLGASVTYDVNRFVGYGAKSTNRHWRTWAQQERKLTINAGNKWEAENNRLILGTAPEGRESDRYKPKMSWTDFEGYELLGDEMDATDS